MDLAKIQDMQDVSEIFGYIIENSCEFANVNKNLNISDWNALEDRIYLVNKVINKDDIESSLDLLVISNTRNFKNIYICFTFCTIHVGCFSLKYTLNLLNHIIN